MAPLDRKPRAPEDRAPAPRTPRRRTGSSREQASEAQRTRILTATVEVASELGAETATVTQIIRRAGVSSGTFYALFEDRQDCLTAVFEEAVAIATKHVSAAYDTEATWVDRVRAAVLALLELLDEERELARLCVGHAVASPTMLLRREEVLDELIPIIDEGRSASRASRNPPPLAAQVVLGGALGLIYARLSARDPCSLVELLNPLMSMIVLPYLGEAAAERELTRPVPARKSVSRKPKAMPDPLGDLELRVTHRTLAVLEAIGSEPGLSNSVVSERAGITDQGQISKLLSRLVRHGLAENLGAGQPKGQPNAWRITRKGNELLRSASRLP